VSIDLFPGLGTDGLDLGTGLERVLSKIVREQN
jgi:hypothetical protein